jgi:hypothetical protein
MGALQRVFELFGCRPATQQLWQVVITDETSTKVLASGQLRLHNVPRPDTRPLGPSITDQESGN